MFGYPRLPLIPGLVVNENIRTHHPLPHHWQYKNGTLMLSDRGKYPKTSKPSLHPPWSASNLPDWLNYDRKVLCFSAYFKENLHEIFKAPHQIRQVKIMYYLEDGTIQINEERFENSGISQGCIVSRQRIQCNSARPYEQITVLDLNIGQTIKIFDRNYYITNCDDFTRKFLNRSGISVPEAKEIPKDPGQMMRESVADSIQPKRPKTPLDFENKLEKFLAIDQQALRFEAYWDDRSSLHGDVWDLVVTYFLFDDTIQINNAANDGPSVFLKRQRLPKNYNGLPMIGTLTNFTVLNVLGGGFLKGRYMADNLGIGNPNITYYNETDLSIGTEIDVFGRKVVLCDCDEFTKEYYRKKYGIEKFEKIPKPIQSKNYWKVELTERTLPPYNGWGTHEDSEGNCKSVEPKPPHRDFRKFIQLDGFILRFGARMLPEIDNRDRVFIVTYFLSDDTIAVYAEGRPNSGYHGGDFHKRGKYYLPNQEWFTSGRPKQYAPSDLFIGATIVLQDFQFKLVAADEFSLSYMENHPFEFPKANIDTIMTKIQTALRPVYKDFVSKYIRHVTVTASKNPIDTQNENQNLRTYICYDTIRAALFDLLGNDITEHEIVTFIRYFSVDATKPCERKCNREVIRSVVQYELYRDLWDDVQRVKEYIYHLDPSIMDNYGFVSPKLLETIIGASKLPIKKVLMHSMFNVLRKNGLGEIDVHDFLSFIDRKQFQGAFPQPINLYDVCPRQPYSERIRLIDWDAFIEKIGLEANLINEID